MVAEAAGKQPVRCWPTSWPHSGSWDLDSVRESPGPKDFKRYFPCRRGLNKPIPVTGVARPPRCAGLPNPWLYFREATKSREKWALVSERCGSDWRTIKKTQRQHKRPTLEDDTLAHALAQNLVFGDTRACTAAARLPGIFHTQHGKTVRTKQKDCSHPLPSAVISSSLAQTPSQPGVTRQYRSHWDKKLRPAIISFAGQQPPRL